MKQTRKWWAVSLGVHVLILYLAAGATVAIGGVEEERNRVALVTEFEPSMWALLDERVEPQEGTSDDVRGLEAGISGVDVAVPDLWEHSDQILASQPRDYGGFEDISTAGGTQRCPCNGIQLGSVVVVCSCNEDNAGPCRCEKAFEIPSELPAKAIHILSPNKGEVIHATY
jgi:hypothetical protein